MRPPIDWTKPIRFVGISGAKWPVRVLDVRVLNPQSEVTVAVDYASFEHVRVVSKIDGTSVEHPGYIENVPPPPIKTYHNYYGDAYNKLSANNARDRKVADEAAVAGRTHVICITQDGGEVTVSVEKVQ